MSSSEAEFQVRGIRDPQLAVHATTSLPAWLWAIDGTRILWANSAGAAVFGATGSSDLARRAFGPADQHRRQIARLAGRLALDGATRLERLRGFGMPLGLLVTCACTRLVFTGGGSGVLIAAVEPIGRAMPYDERVQRLIDDIDAPIAAFTNTGTLAGMNTVATSLFAADATRDAVELAPLGFDEALHAALHCGTAEITAPVGHFALHRVGQGTDTSILAFITPAAARASTAAAPHDTPLQTPLRETPDAVSESGNLRLPELPRTEDENCEPTSEIETTPLSGSVDLSHGEAFDASPLEGSVAQSHVKEASQPALSVNSVEEDTSVEEDMPEIASVPLDATPVAEDAQPVEKPAAIDKQDTVEIAAAIPTSLAPDEPSVTARRHPLRFMWQIDAQGRFSLGSDEFSRLIGPRTATAFGRPWSEIVALFGIDPEGRVAGAIATRNTWSGIMIDWPADGTGSRLPVELSGLPVYDQARQFLGYRGFGVCRDLDGLTRLAIQRQSDALSPDSSLRDHTSESTTNSPIGMKEASSQAASDATSLSMQTKTDDPVDTPENVVLFPSTTDPKVPTLTPVENNAFNELARQLASRLEAERVERDVRNKTGETPEPPANSIVDELRENGPSPAAIEPAPTSAFDTSAQELGTILDATGDGILIFDANGRIATCNRGAEVMFGFDEHDIASRYLTDLFTQAADRASVLECLASIKSTETGQQTREVHGRTRTGETLSLALTIGRTLKKGDRYFAICRKLLHPHGIETDLRPSKRQADRAAHARSDILARISHEVRTPLSAIIGFADIIIEERFGTLGNERYATYMKDIRAAGERVLALINDLLDLSRIETGKLDLTFERHDLNDMVEKCVSAMQPQANRERIIIRTSLAHALPQVTADASSLRQIVMNLVGNSIHIAKAGGQVIVSTALTDLGDVVLRIRDTGRSLNYSEMEAALEQFRNPASEQLVQDNAGINLSLTRALVEANLAQFQIRSAPQSGTLVEVSFSQKAAQAV